MNKNQIQNILNKSLETGADFGELFFEKSINNSINIMNGEVVNISTGEVYGVGVRLLKGSKEVYGYTNEVKEDVILELLENLKASFNDKPNKVTKLGEKLPFNNNITRPFELVETSEKVSRLLELNKIMKDESPLIIQSITNLIEKKQDVLIASTDGTYQDDKKQQHSSKRLPNNAPTRS